MRYFIGNLPYTVTEQQICSALADHNPDNLDIVRDKLTGRQRGYAFVDCDDEPAKGITVGIRRIHIGQAHGAH